MAQGMELICVRLAYDLSMALELVKYQTIMVMLFASHFPARCLEYDSLLRQAIPPWAGTPSHSATTLISLEHLHFSCPTPNISLSWAPSSQVKQSDSTARYIHCRKICKRYNAGCYKRGKECNFTHICWHPGCQGEHPGKVCAKRP